MGEMVVARGFATVVKHRSDEVRFLFFFVRGRRGASLPVSDLVLLAGSC